MRSTSGKAGVLDDFFDVVGLVDHEDDGALGEGWDGEVEVGVAGSGVVGAAEPEAVVAALDGDEAVDEHGGFVGFEGADDVFGADRDVVVAEDAEALRRLESGEDFGAGSGGAQADAFAPGAAGDEVSGKQDEVGGELVDAVDHLLEERGFGVLDEVDVAHLDDAEVDEGVGEVADGDGAVGDFDGVAAVGDAVEDEGGGDGGASHQEGAAREEIDGGVRAGGWSVGHSP